MADVHEPFHLALLVVDEECRLVAVAVMRWDGGHAEEVAALVPPPPEDGVEAFFGSPVRVEGKAVHNDRGNPFLTVVELVDLLDESIQADEGLECALENVVGEKATCGHGGVGVLGHGRGGAEAVSGLSANVGYRHPQSVPLLRGQVEIQAGADDGALVGEDEKHPFQFRSPVVRGQSGHDTMQTEG